MKKLLSLPPNLVKSFHDVEGLPASDYFCASDPVGCRLGSGGGTAWLLHQARQSGFLNDERCILIHAGGQSRRLPAYAPTGKVLAPVMPDGANLLSVCVPFCESLMHAAPPSLQALVVSGDALITTSEPLPSIPEADVVCMALEATPAQLSRHGVYAMRKDSGAVLDFMLQKPSESVQQRFSDTHTLLLDIGLWMLSERALKLLHERAQASDGSFVNYDLYGQFGTALGLHPSATDAGLRDLTVAVVPLPGGRFLHFGTTAELLSSAEVLTRESNPQRIWVENSRTEGWTLTHHHVITGVPRLDAPISLSPGQCVDVVPVGAEAYAVRPYGYDDAFRGAPQDAHTRFLGQPLRQWLASHHVDCADILTASDIQSAPLFPVTDRAHIADLLRWMLSPASDACHPCYLSAPRLSADQLTDGAALDRLYAQRRAWREDTFDEAAASARLRTMLTAPLLDGHEVEPHIDPQVTEVRATAPLRIDVSGGWTDTPPFCIQHGGAVVNVSLLLNGDAPLSCVIRPLDAPYIRIVSCDMGTSCLVQSYADVSDFAHLRSAFSIPKAALALVGFEPRFNGHRYPSLSEQLSGRGFELTMNSPVPAGSGLGTSSILAATVLAALAAYCHLDWSAEEIGYRTLVLEQLLTAGGGWQDQYGGIIPGAKLLTSQPGPLQKPQVTPLPSTLWVHPELAPCHLLYFTGITRTARQILGQIVRRMFLRDRAQQQHLFQMKAHAQVMADAVRMAAADPWRGLEAYGQCLRQNWTHNCQLDEGCCPPAIGELCRKVDDLCLGYKLPGAGGGGFLYMVAKDADAADCIRKRLNDAPTAPNAGFYDFGLARYGLHVVCVRDGVLTEYHPST